MDLDPDHQLLLQSHAPIAGDPFLPPPALEASAPQMDSNQWAYSSDGFNQGWCYMAASPEPIDHGNHGDGDDPAASVCVFPSRSQRSTLVEEKDIKKPSTKDGEKKKNYTSSDTLQLWEANTRSYLMSQGAMEGEDHRCYDRYFDTTGSPGVRTPYPYAQTLDLEYPENPEPNDRAGDVDVDPNRRVSWVDQTQEDGEWDDCAIDGLYPAPDGFEEGNPTAQGHYQPGRASWFRPFYRH